MLYTCYKTRQKKSARLLGIYNYCRWYFIRRLSSGKMCGLYFQCLLYGFPIYIYIWHIPYPRGLTLRAFKLGKSCLLGGGGGCLGGGGDPGAFNSISHRNLP